MWNNLVSIAFVAVDRATFVFAQAFWLNPALAMAILAALAVFTSALLIEAVVDRLGKTAPDNEVLNIRPIRLKKRD